MLEEHLIFPLHLFYGLAFFAIGAAIVSRNTWDSELAVARPLWLFALFAFLHALLEWYSLYLILYSSIFPQQLLLFVDIIRLALVFVSFLFLLAFGANLLWVVFTRLRTWFLVLVTFYLLAILALLLSTTTTWDSFLLSVIDLRIRNYIAFPGAVLSATAMILYSQTVRNVSRRGARNFMGAGISIMIYGILAGLLPSGKPVPLVGGPVELYRGLAAVCILHFVMHALHIFDVERKRKIEDHLNRYKQSEKLHALGKLAFGIAHEINNPLSNAQINVELLKSDMQSRNFPSCEKKLDVIERNLARASKIAKEMLFFSTNKESEFQPSDVNDIMKSTLELLVARRNDYEIRIGFGSGETIMAIPWKLEEVFLNIILNAMEAMPDGGVIDITTEAVAAKVVVTIADTGPGIPENNLDSVLDPFFTTKEVGKGTGLGLSICYGIMQLHGGTISVHNRQPNGAAVVLEFPKGEDRHA